MIETRSAGFPGTYLAAVCKEVMELKVVDKEGEMSPMEDKSRGKLITVNMFDTCLSGTIM
jgi:hypothetical protein